jgi:hypothetical protein
MFIMSYTGFNHPLVVTFNERRQLALVKSLSHTCYFIRAGNTLITLATIDFAMSHWPVQGRMRWLAM